MSETEKKKKIVYRLPPCPSYDVEGIESWLNDLARDGLLLEKDGLWLGVMSFEKTTPQTVRYSLQAAQKTYPFTENDEYPSTEEQELSQAFGWKYLTTYGQFYIYRTADPNARPMNTDQEIHAMSLNAVRKRERNSLIFNLLYLAFWIFLCFYQSPVLHVAAMGTPLALLVLTVLVWAEIGQIITFVRLHQLYIKIRDGGVIDSHKDWKKNARAHKTEMIIYLLLVAVIIVLSMHSCYASVMEEDVIPLSQYDEDPPFVSISDLEPSGTYLRIEDSYSNEFREWTDILFPVNCTWHERAEIKTDHGTISGSIYVTYHEAAFPWLAKELAKGYLQEAQDSKYFHDMELPQLDVDYAVAFGSSPTVIIQDGNVIVKAVIFVTDEDENTMYQEWAVLMAQMLQ